MQPAWPLIIYVRTAPSIIGSLIIPPNGGLALLPSSVFTDLSIYIDSASRDAQVSVPAERILGQKFTDTWTRIILLAAESRRARRIFLSEEVLYSASLCVHRRTERTEKEGDNPDAFVRRAG